jgi:hypothetical protein
MSRQRLMRISSCSQVPRASGPWSVTMRALWPRTAPISARWSWMLRSRVMMSQPRVATCGSQSTSRVAGVIVHGGLRRLCMTPPGSPG